MAHAWFLDHGPCPLVKYKVYWVFFLRIIRVVGGMYLMFEYFNLSGFNSG